MTRRRFLLATAATGIAVPSFVELFRSVAHQDDPVPRLLPEHGPFRRSADNPILSSTDAWEESGCVQEPSVIYESGVWKMWYTGGWTAPAIGYASCTGDPMVAANWTKHPGNPVLGQGGSGVEGWASGTSVFKVDSVYYCFFYDAFGGGNLKVSTSPDGIAWTQPKTVLRPGEPAWATRWAADCAVWKEAGVWKALFSCSTNPDGGQPWELAYAESTAAEPTSGWAVDTSGPVRSLAPAGTVTGTYGSPTIARINGLYHCWLHAGPPGDYTNIYAAASRDGRHWRLRGLVLRANRTRFESQQVADPSVVEGDGAVRMFYDGVDNDVPLGYIDAASFPGTLEQLVDWRNG